MPTQAEIQLQALQEQLTRVEARQRRFMHICVLLGFLLVGCVICAVLLAAPTVRQIGQDLDQLAQVTTLLDADTLTGAANALATLQSLDVAALQDGFAALGQVDMATLQTALADIQQASQRLTQLDIEALNAALETLQRTLGPLANLFGG